MKFDIERAHGTMAPREFTTLEELMAFIDDEEMTGWNAVIIYPKQERDEGDGIAFNRSS